MSKWYLQIISAKDGDYSAVGDAIEFFTEEVEKAQIDCKISGKVEKMMSELPGISEYRYAQYQEVEAILKWIETKLERARTIAFKKFLEGYNRQLSSRDAEKYALTDPDVMNLTDLKNHVSYLASKYAGVMKALEYKHFQLGYIVKLKTAGMEDYTI